MAGNALVTGSAERATAVGGALAEVGFNVTTVDREKDLVAVCAALGTNSVDCYVQLPVDIIPSGQTTLERVRSFLDQGLLARFEAARTVLPTLAANSAVLLVSGNLLDGDAVNDDQRARISLLRVLAHCVLADAGAAHAYVTVVDHRRTAEQIAAISLDRGKSRLRMINEFAEQNPDLSYDDWKLAIFSLTTSEM